MKIPSRGEIWLANPNPKPNLNPTEGREQQGLRPLLVVSSQAFNRLGLCVVCPITQGGSPSRFAGFAVTLMGAGTQTQGVVMCNQPRTIDLAACAGRFVEDVDREILDEVLARTQAIFDN